jgi:hypothetical protein
MRNRKSSSHSRRFSRTRRRRRRRRALIGAGLLGAILAAGGLAASLGLGSGPAQDSAGCVVADVSRSTEEARGRYLAEFSRFATEIGNEGSGRLCLILAAADPSSEGAPIFASVGPEPGDAGTPKAAAEIEAKVKQATGQFAELLAHPPVKQRGSALVEAADVAAEVLEPGDRLLYLSDGLQWSRAVGHLQDEDLSAAAIARLLDKVEREGMMANLRGVQVSFPLLLFHPGGLKGGAVRAAQLRSFWEGWGRRTGADLTIGERFE